MATCSLATLLDQACENGFRCVDEQTFRGVLLQLLCDYQASGGGGGGGDDPFVSGDLSVEPATVSAAHGLSAAPSFVRVVVVCIANDAGVGSVAGDEIGIEGFWDVVDNVPNFGVSSNSTSVTVTNMTFRLGSEGDANVIYGGIRQATSAANFRIKIYASL